MRAFVFILFFVLGVNFLINSETNTNIDYTSIIESVVSPNDDVSAMACHESFVPLKNAFNNNRAFDITNTYNFFTRLCEKYNRVNSLYSQESIVWLKSIIKLKSLSPTLLLSSDAYYDSSLSLYKFLNPCDYYTYHNHRIII